MRVVAVVNQKGGVGKTALVLGLASAAQARGQDVLVVDADPQGNATTVLGPQEPADGPAFDLHDVLSSASPGALYAAALPCAWGPGVKVVGATLALQEAEQDTSIAAEQRMNTVMRDPPQDVPGLVLIDCPPSIGRLTVGALIAANLALVVTEPSAPALQGVSAVLESVETVRQHYNPSLKVAGIVVNRHLAHHAEPTRRLDEIRDVYGNLVLDLIVPSRTIVAEAMGARIPIHEYPPSKAGDVQTVMDQILDRLLTAKIRKKAR